MRGRVWGCDRKMGFISNAAVVSGGFWHGDKYIVSSTSTSSLV